VTVRLAPIDPQAFRALEAGDRVVAEQLIGVPVPDEFQEPVEIWSYMLQLLRDDPTNADWLMNAVVAEGVIVGNAGFKGAPVGGQVELGYRISPSHRRRGLAVVAVTLLLDRARHEPLVDRVIARIAPGNDASVGVITKAGFVPDGEWMNPRWGRQLQFAHPTPSP
jgi:ribosomal-protein-alanine N-acetyltransferase